MKGINVVGEEVESLLSFCFGRISENCILIIISIMMTMLMMIRAIAFPLDRFTKNGRTVLNPLNDVGFAKATKFCLQEARERTIR